MLQQKGLFINFAQYKGQAAAERDVDILCTTTKSGYSNYAKEKDSLQQKGLLINSALQKCQSAAEDAAVHKICKTKRSGCSRKGCS